MQSRPTPLGFVPEEHTDFVFRVEVTNWPALLTAVGTIAITLGVPLNRWRRRTHDQP